MRKTQPIETGERQAANEGCLSRLVVRELLDHIEGMRLYYSGPSHQDYKRCVCRDCIDSKIAEWRKNTKGEARGARQGEDHE